MATFARTWASYSSFINHVLARLQAQEAGETDLSRLWREVTTERQDPKEHAWRKLEARLGFDADEVPEQIMHDLLSMCDQAGQDAVDEIAPA